MDARKGRVGEGKAAREGGTGGGTAKPPHRLAASGRRKAGRRFFGEFGWPVKGAPRFKSLAQILFGVF